MTDNEIIKAYELCFAEKGTSYTCAVCPYHQFGELCKVNRDKDALDLIHRQKAEIEVLNHSLDTLGRVKEQLKESLRGQESKASEEIHSLCAEIRTLKKTNKAYEEECNRLICLIPKTRAEAIKEFAERLKESKIDVDVSFGYGREVYTAAVAVIEIDNLVKEMVGENP